MKPVVRSALAQSDIEDALDYYLTEAPHMAQLFIDALESAVVLVRRQPGGGSSRYAHEVGIADLRFWPLRKFPYCLFYLELQDHLRVVRLLHMSRDIPGSLQSSH